jgi:hypothetical protein
MELKCTIKFYDVPDHDLLLIQLHGEDSGVPFTRKAFVDYKDLAAFSIEANAISQKTAREKSGADQKQPTTQRSTSRKSPMDPNKLLVFIADSLVLKDDVLHVEGLKIYSEYSQLEKLRIKLAEEERKQKFIGMDDLGESSAGQGSNATKSIAKN